MIGRQDAARIHEFLRPQQPRDHLRLVGQVVDDGAPILATVIESTYQVGGSS
jgi:hypothetical protein